ncbi:unnamed protein product [Diamesa serratosioi]
MSSTSASNGGSSTSNGIAENVDSSDKIHHSCEICGVSGLSDDKMIEHTQKCHVEGNNPCPFCGLTGVSAPEMLLHVNQVHLDYLTPEHELMSFIDDQTPSMQMSMSSSTGSSSSLISTNGTTSKSSNGTTELPIIFNYNINGIDSTLNNNNNNNNSDKNCDINGGKVEISPITNGVDHPQPQQQQQQQHGEGSPLRSQLGLKLKANNKPKVINTSITTTASSINSPLQCLMCPYTTDNPRILEEHINRSHFDPISPSVNGCANGGGPSSTNSHHMDTLDAFQCPICVRCFETCSDLEVHVNCEHRDILSPAKIDHTTGGASATTSFKLPNGDSAACSLCPICGISFENMKTQDMELHIDKHFDKSPAVNPEPDLEKEAQKLREQREFELLRAQYGMDDQGNFREQSAVAMQRAVYAGEMSVADYYCRQVGLRAAESNGIDDGSSCTKSVAARVASLSSASPGVTKSYVCSGIDHYASSYGDKGWGCGYRNLQMMLSSLFQNPALTEKLSAPFGSTSMPSISRLQKMVESAWAMGFDVQGKEQLGCKLYNTRKWIGATEVVTVFSWMRVQCQLVDFHRPSSPDGRHPELFNYVMRYFEQPRSHTPPLYLQHQGHSRTIIGIEHKSSGLTLLILDPSHSPRQVASLGSSQDSLRLIRRGPSAMKAPQYQIVAIRGAIETEEEYQASKVMKSHRIPPDR